MFIHRILTRIHKTKNTIVAVNQIASKNTIQYAHFSSRKTIVNEIIYTPPRRHIFLNNFRKPSIEKFKRVDNIPNDYELIYRSNLTNYLFSAQISAVCGLVFVFGTVIFNYCVGSKEGFLISISDNIMNISNDKLQYIAFSVVFVVLNVAALFLITKFPIRMYYNENTNKFITVLYGLIPKSKKFITINSGEAVHVKSNIFVNSILPWNDSRYRLKNGKRIILLDHHFRKLEYLNLLLGHAKI